MNASENTPVTGGPDQPAEDRGSEGPVSGRSLWKRLYSGDTRIDVVGRRRTWFLFSAALLLISVGSLAVRGPLSGEGWLGGLNLSIDFEGGNVWEFPTEDVSVADAREALAPFGLEGATIQTVERQDAESGQTARRLRIATPELADQEDKVAVTAALEELTGAEVEDAREVSSSWGKEITEKARNALLAFLVLVTVYIALRFQLKSALPAMVALVHDVAITVGVYSVGQFNVAPGTVIAFLTILGYSLYDTVVVFDKVRENDRLVTANGNVTYGAMVNLTLNQTLMRSINTTVTSVLPVLSLLVIGSWVMGAATLQDFALALLIGLIAGTYSSFFIAAPLLAMLKEREPVNRRIRERVMSQGEDPNAVPDRIGVAGVARPGTPKRGGLSPAAPSPTSNGGEREVTLSPSGRVIPARPRKKTRKR